MNHKATRWHRAVVDVSELPKTVSKPNSVNVAYDIKANKNKSNTSDPNRFYYYLNGEWQYTSATMDIILERFK